MKCPYCGGSLKATHTYAEAFSVRRRRVCERCKSTLYTLEHLENSLIEEGLLDGYKEEEAVKQDGEEEKRSLKEKDA